MPKNRRQCQLHHEAPHPRTVPGHRRAHPSNDGPDRRCRVSTSNHLPPLNQHAAQLNTVNTHILNLTAANYVHIVEPQWNPSVEEQAIAGAVRMGQTRAVTIIRYVVKNSVEEVS